MIAKQTSTRVCVAFAAALATAALAALALIGSGAPHANAAAERIVPRGGFYQGVTSQGNQCSYGSDMRCQVTFKVRNGVANSGTFELRLPLCTVKFWVYDSDAVNRRTGRFELEGSSSEIRGRFVTRRFVRGTVYGESSGGCGSKTVSFTAHPK